MSGFLVTRYLWGVWGHEKGLVLLTRHNFIFRWKSSFLEPSQAFISTSKRPAQSFILSRFLFAENLEAEENIILKEKRI